MAITSNTPHRWLDCMGGWGGGGGIKANSITRPQPQSIDFNRSVNSNVYTMYNNHIDVCLIVTVISYKGKGGGGQSISIIITCFVCLLSSCQCCRRRPHHRHRHRLFPLFLTQTSVIRNHYLDQLSITSTDCDNGLYTRTELSSIACL